MLIRGSTQNKKFNTCSGNITIFFWKQYSAMFYASPKNIMFFHMFRQFSFWKDLPHQNYLRSNLFKLQSCLPFHFSNIRLSLLLLYFSKKESKVLLHKWMHQQLLFIWKLSLQLFRLYEFQAILSYSWS